MGLYSTNRVASVTESVNSLVGELDWTPDFSIGSMMEAVIQIHENDSRMFDSLIECDFISANNRFIMNEADASESEDVGNETKKKKISEKIQGLLESIKALINKVASNFIAKLIDIVKSDKKICSTYEKVLTLDNLKEFEGIPNFNFPKANLTEDSLKSLETVKKFNADFIDRINKAEDKETIDTTFEEFKSKIDGEKKEYKKLDEDETYFTKTPEGEKWKPTDNIQITKMLNSVGYSSDTIKNMKQAAAKTISQLKDLQKEAKNACIKFTQRKKTEEVVVYKFKRLYDISSITTKVFSKEFSAYIRLASKQIAAYRKALILCGRAAAKYAKKGEGADDKETQSVNDAAIMSVLGEASDNYVYECLGY